MSRHHHSVYHGDCPMLALFLLLMLIVAVEPVPAADLYRIWLDGDEHAYYRICAAHRTVLSLKGQFVDALLAEPELAALKRQGLRLEFVQRDPEAFMKRIAADRGPYRSYDAMVAELRRLAREHPALVRLRDIGDGWEKTAGLAGRDVWAVGIYSPKAERAPVALLLAGVHAREIATTEVLMDLLQQLVKRQQSDPEVRRLLDTRRIWVVPLLNPDGREFVFTSDPWWRKNRHRFSDESMVGVDLNRNFPFYWASGAGSSDSPASAVFRGTAPFSEPETAALASLVKQLEPAASLSFHSYGEYILTPYGYPMKQPEDRSVYDTIRREISARTGYPAGTVGELLGYYSSGRHDDWLYAMRQVMSLEMELGRTFFPEASELPGLSRVAEQAAFYTIRVAGSWPRASLEMARPEPRAHGAAGTAVLRATLHVSNHGLGKSSPLRWRLEPQKVPFVSRPAAGLLSPMEGLKAGSPKRAVALEIRLEQPIPPVAGVPARLVLTDEAGGEESLPLELRVGPVPGE